LISHDSGFADRELKSDYHSEVLNYLHNDSGAPNVSFILVLKMKHRRFLNRCHQFYIPRSGEEREVPFADLTLITRTITL